MYSICRHLLLLFVAKCFDIMQNFAFRHYENASMSFHSQLLSSLVAPFINMD